MPRILDALVANSAYFFIAVGVIWLAIAVIAASPLVAWPVVACIAGGIMLRQWPAGRLTWAWCIATAVMGFLLSAYQVYAWLSFLGGAFSSLAAISMVGFALLAVVHVLLFYAGSSKPRTANAPSS